MHYDSSDPDIFIFTGSPRASDASMRKTGNCGTLTGGRRERGNPADSAGCASARQKPPCSDATVLREEEIRSREEQRTERNHVRLRPGEDPPGYCFENQKARAISSAGCGWHRSICL